MLARYPIKFGGDLTNLGLQIIDFALQVIRNRLASACARYALASALVREIARLVHSDQQRPTKLRSHDLTRVPAQAWDIARDQWLSRLVAAVRKLDAEDMKLAVHLIEMLMRFREMQGAK